MVIGSMLSFGSVVSAATVDDAIHYTDQKVDGVVQYVNQKADGLVHYTDQKADSVVQYVNQKADGLVNYTNQQVGNLRQDVKRNEKGIADNFDLIQNNIDAIDKNKKDISCLNKRVDNHNAWLHKHDEQIQNHDQQLQNQTKRMENQEKRIDGQDKRLDYLDGRLDKHNARIENQDKRLESHERRIESNKSLSTEALAEAKKHTTLKAGSNVDITSTLNENGGAEYTVSVNRLHMGDVAIDENGLNNGGNTITNVANGVHAKDAVNVSQLNRVDAKADLNTEHINLVENNVNANTAKIARIDDKVDGLRTSMDTRFDKVDSDIAKVGANSAALSALHPLSFNANEKVEYAIGYGNYKGENAVAVGVFAHPNENTLFSLGATFGGGSNMVNAGATFRFGHVNKQVTNVNTAVAKDVQDLTKNYEALAQKYDNLLKRLGMEDESVEVNTAEVEKAQRFVINRVDGEDNDAYKTERVSVNTQSEEFTYRDAYGTEMK